MNSDKIHSEVRYTGSPLSRNQGVNLSTTLFFIPLALKEMTEHHIFLLLRVEYKNRETDEKKQCMEKVH